MGLRHLPQIVMRPLCSPRRLPFSQGMVVGNGASFNNAHATNLQLTGPLGTSLSFSNTGATSNQFAG